MEQKHNKLKLFTATLICKLADDEEAFISEDAIKTNPEQTKLYINPYGYCMRESGQLFYVSITKTADGIRFHNTNILFPEVVHSCPPNWETVEYIPIIIGKVSEVLETINDPDKHNREVEVRNMWKGQDLIDKIQIMEDAMKALEETDNFVFSDRPIIISMRKLLLQDIQQCTSTIEILDTIKHLTYSIDENDESDENLKIHDSEKEWTTLAILQKLKAECNTKFDTLSKKGFSDPKTPKLISGKKQIKELSIDELRESHHKYSTQEIKEFLDYVSSNSVDDVEIDKAVLLQKLQKQ